MTIKQIAVFLENRKGRIASVTQVLRDAGINIRTLTIADTAEFGILRMIVNKPDEATDILGNAGFTVKENLIIAVEVDDRPGILASLMGVCDEHDLNVEYIYSFVEQYSDKAIIFLRFEDNQQAIRVLQQEGYKLLSDSEIRKL